MLSWYYSEPIFFAINIDFYFFILGALKFGYPLFPDECEVLLKNLSECHIPFQCAHGRPALVPIVDLRYLQSQQTRVSSFAIINIRYNAC